ncbi:MAG: outer membrane beta-barrel protein [Bacteroidales bacterium]|jgi:hypothetical protein|nr:outer membrane beta-barrel protein [Bacteroidales bacterium]MDD4213661.1 outer membrane beta-barrel protein [Bacteroidales bacterium]
MKKYLIIFANLFIVSVFAYSQEMDADTNYWGVSIYGSVDYNTQFIKGSTIDPMVGVDSMKKIDLPRCGYTLGFSVNRPVYKILSLEFGIFIHSQGYRTGTLPDTIWNYRDSILSITDYHKSYRYYSLNIPVLLKVDIVRSKKVTFGIGVGVAPVFSLGKQQVSFFEDHKEIVHEKTGRDIDIQALGCLFVSVPLTDKLSLTLEPTFRYNILSYKDSYYQGITRNMLSAGLGIYLTYKVTDKAMYDYYYKKIYNVKNPMPQF